MARAVSCFPASWEFLVWLKICGIVLRILISLATISLRQRGFIYLHIELLLLSFFVATPMVCGSFLFGSECVM